MSLSPLNEKNTRKFSDGTGIDFERVVGWGSVEEFEGRTAGDRHYKLRRFKCLDKMHCDRWHYEATYLLDFQTTHWSSCEMSTILFTANTGLLLYQSAPADWSPYVVS